MKDNDPEKSGSFWERFVAVVSIAIAIGAYSGDSIMVKIFTSDDVYSVVMSGFINSEAQYYALYDASNKSRLIPITVLVYFSVRNDGNQDQIVESVGYEVMTRDNEWLAADCILVDSEIFEVKANNFQQATKANFATNNLLKNLGQGVIKPKQVISGWLLVKYPAQIQDSLVYKTPSRISLHSGFGESESHDAEPIYNTAKVTSTKRATVFYELSGQRDLSKIPIGNLDGN